MMIPISQNTGGSYGGQSMYDYDIDQDQVKETITAQENESIIKYKLDINENN